MPSSADRRVRNPRIAGFMILVVALAASFAPAQLKISQFSGAGANGSAQYLSDYIELYNPTAAPVVMTNWSIQYAAATGTTWSKVTLNATIQPNRYFLIQQASGTTGSAPALPTPDVSSTTINLSVLGGKIALCNDNTTLTGGQPTAASIVDFVGYGQGTTLADWREPFVGGTTANNAPGGGNVNATFRLNCGAQDTNNNAADFAVGWPNPRNSATPPAIGMMGTATASPFYAIAGTPVVIRCTPQLCGGGTSATTVAFVDLTNIGGAAGTPLVDDGTGADEYALDGIFTAAATVGAVAAGTKSLPITFNDGINSGGCYAAVLVNAATAPANDACTGATVLSGPFTGPGVTVSGTFTGATPEWNGIGSITNPPGPSAGMANSPGIWYSVNGTGTTLTASLCATTPAIDTRMVIMCGPCDAPVIVASGDDNGPSCTGTAASARWCAAAGTTYRIFISPFSTTFPSTAAYSLLVTDDGVPCSTAAPCTTCTFVPPASFIAEQESVFGPATNDGGDSQPLLQQTIPGAFPVTIVGTARGYGTARDSDWYRFQASATQTFQATLSAPFAGVVSVHPLDALGNPTATSLASGVFSPVSGRCGSTVVSTVVSAGSWYAIRVLHAPNFLSGTITASVFGGLPPHPSQCRYQIDVATGLPPTNDACASAIALATTNTYVTGITSGATPDGTSSCDSVGNDVWYSVVVPAPNVGLAIDTCGSSMDTVVSVYSGTCGALVPVNCNDDCGGAPCAATSSCLTLTGLAPGTYIIRVSDKGTPGLFQIRASLTIPVNDACSGALPMNCGDTIAGTTIGATTDTLTACPGPGSPTGVTIAATGGVWYTITPATSQTLILSTLGTSFDTKIHVYTGSCAALTCVMANDDAFPSGLQSRVAFPAIGGTQYFVMVQPFSGTGGVFTLAASCQTPPVNDDCAAPSILAPVTGGSVSGTTVGSSAANVADPSCSAKADSDVWYSYTACANGTVVFDTCGTYNTVVSIHTACPGASNNQVSGACNDDGPTGCLPGSQVTLTVTGGTTYLIRVASNDTTNAGGAFTLRWTVTAGLVTLYQDLDGDGFGNLAAPLLNACPTTPGYVANSLDCDDMNQAVNPTATEVCDGIDNNCNGLTDDADPGVTGQPTWYQDSDLDGFGNSAVFVVACTAPSGYVANALDCNDGCSSCYPGAPEVCDGLDNNCNGQTDEGVLTTWYQDGDADGYGNPAVFVTACTQPSGYVANSLDCNDGDFAINPGATEVCDGFDNDCDGLTDDADPSVIGQSTWYADTDNDGFGNPSASVLACVQPVGYVADNTDCNDTCAACHPGAVEICDGLDNDCNGQTDEICPSNDFCANATPIGDGTFSGDCSNAATQVGMPALCFTAANDLWYSYANPGSCPKTVTVSLCPTDGGSASFNAGLAAFSGACGGLTTEACNDDTCGTNPKVTFTVPGGSTRLIMVAASGGPGGAFTMVVSHTSASTTAVGSSCPLAAMSLSTTIPVIGQPASINLTGGPSGAIGLLLFSANAAAVPAAVPPSGCLLYTDPMGLGIFTVFSTDALGNWSIGGPVPNDPGLECVTATFQALVSAPVAGGFAFSNGVSIVFGY